MLLVKGKYIKSLINFALSIFRKYYGCPMAGFSIPAAEHR